MAITDDLRKTLTDRTPLYFAAGTADLAVQQALKVPALIEQLRAEAPERFEAVRNTDPKAVQEKVTTQAKEAQATVQAKVTEVFGALDAADLKKLGESAQDMALRGVGIAAEYAVRARETYEKVAVHGEQAVRTWRGETADEIVEIAAVVEGEPMAATKSETKPAAATTKSAPKPAAVKTVPAAEGATPAEAKAAPAKKAPAPRKPAARKDTPPAGK
ncbi:hypothetical protein AMK21_11345 [Streptomyces sp. CB00316]|uniref:hypothetical protein n=1 Tax=unclassified Streptomyces TaxID=2593676 RepID=UPI00093E59AE|nr:MULTISPECIES: hypothetical protein [unclassified Streptomyces]MBT2427842.1 hypothetical protein [Streptomyces sp. ISL-112]MBT2464647.1 hypothetical protein [Streptomyces sp. ISL-63]OKJ20561.1 hypothetical protein AMK21_11345 [Streptomyces sp. CB00316]